MTRFLILFKGHSTKDFKVVEGTLEYAIQVAKEGYDDYGHNAAIVLPYEPVYKVWVGEHETTDKNEIMGASLYD